MTRRCLICANINPCREHSEYAQDAELGRNMREIAAIEARTASGTLPRENAKRSRAKPSGPTGEAGDAQP